MALKYIGHKAIMLGGRREVPSKWSATKRDEMIARYPELKREYIDSPPKAAKDTEEE